MGLERVFDIYDVGLDKRCERGRLARDEGSGYKDDGRFVLGEGLGGDGVGVARGW